MVFRPLFVGAIYLCTPIVMYAVVCDSMCTDEREDMNRDELLELSFRVNCGPMLSLYEAERISRDLAKRTREPVLVQGFRKGEAAEAIHWHTHPEVCHA